MGAIGYGRSSIQMVACPFRDIILVENGCFRKKRAVRYEMCLIDITYLTERSIVLNQVFYQYII